MSPNEGAKAARIASLLGQGYGVEDIALMIGHPVDEVRAQVALWRRQGMLRAWWPKREAPAAKAEA